MSPRKIGRPKKQKAFNYNKPWDVPPPPSPDSFDKNFDELYLAVGKALSIWESAEEELADLFAILVGNGKSSNAARRSYGSIATTRGKIEMLVAAAEIYFQEFPETSLEEKFNELIESASGFAARRNEIAHGKVRPIQTDKRTLYALLPPRHSTPKLDANNRPSFAYNSGLIGLIMIGFRDIERNANQLVLLIASKHRALKASLEKPV